MNSDDDDVVLEQLKHNNYAVEPPPKINVKFIKSLNNRKLRNDTRVSLDLQVYAEDELVKKKYKEMRCEMPGTPRSTFLMVFSPDGTRVASTHGNHNVYVTDLKNGKNVRTLIGHPRTPWCIAFHPSCNDLLASGCLGGQVRVWDLSGGSEVWTAGNQTVIASIAFHPNDRILVIATFNELYFWDWSKPEPFAKVSTSNVKEKVRFVAFDKLGHKLITGIANTPQSRWERSRASAPPSRMDRSRIVVPESPDMMYRSRVILSRRNNSPYRPYVPQPLLSSTPNTDRVPLSSVPERERRITACYRNLVHEYELLVHRYLQVYRPPATIDRGTDPMEWELLLQSSDSDTPANESPTVSRSSGFTNYSSRYLSQPGPSTSGTQQQVPSTSSGSSFTAYVPQAERFSPSQIPEINVTRPQTSSLRRLVMRTSLGVQTSSETPPQNSEPSNQNGVKMRIKCSPKKTQPEPSEAGPSKASDPTPTSPRWSHPVKRFYPGAYKKPNKHNRKPILDTSSDNSSSEEESLPKRQYIPSKPSTSSSTIHSPTSTSTNTQTSEQPNQNTLPPWYFRRKSRTENMPSSTFTQSTSPREKIVCLANLVSNNACHDALRRSNGSSICDRCGGNMESENNSDSIPASTQDTSDSTRLTENLESNTNRAETTTTTTVSDSGVNSRSPPLPPPSSIPSLDSNAPEEASNQPCARTLVNTDTLTTNSTIYTPSNTPRNRIVSRFFIQRPGRISVALHPAGSTIDNYLRSGRLSNNFICDEVVNYSERVNSEDDTPEPTANVPEFHPFDPPPEIPSINPENIGIGNMYSNIVQDLESSLNNVRNLRASNRPGETSDMLSSFSERLESIMLQSDNILRNLSQTTDLLLNSEQSEIPRPATRSTTNARPVAPQPTVYLNEPTFYVREQSTTTSPTSTEPHNAQTRNELLDSILGYNNNNSSEDINTNRWAIASDHTYPRNPESTRPAPRSSDNLQPLMTSLHLTISHIQRQARLLRIQVEFIERIDRAMVEVAQLQTIRQMFGELQRHLTNLVASDNRSAGVSSVRQMMAGTRISDSSPYDSPNEEDANRTPTTTEPNPTTSTEPTPSTSGTTRPATSAPTTSRRSSSRKSYPPSRFLHGTRHNRRYSVLNVFPRRLTARERLMRRRLYFRAISIRPSGLRLPTDNEGILEDDTNYSNSHNVNSESLLLISRRLERLLAEHIRLVDRRGNHTSSRDSAQYELDDREGVITARLDTCRSRLFRLLGLAANQINRIEPNNVTSDGRSRFPARETLSSILEILSSFFYENRSSISQTLRSQLRSVIDLNLLLSDILLLQIVESIPPPTGMNLNPERESLSNRIDRMCSRMLQSRYSQNLARSLRLMRLTVRCATRDLRPPTNILFENEENRRELLSQINSTMRSIQRTRQEDPNASTADAYPQPQNNDSVTSEIPVREWYRTINALITRYAAVSSQATSNLSAINSRRSNPNEETARSDNQTNSDDNDDYEPTGWNNTSSNSERRQSLYRTSNVNLINNIDAPSFQPRVWNVPTVQINDVPISESNSTWHSRLTQHRYRLSELHGNRIGNLFRPRFLHPLYAGINPFESDLEDSQREQMYDGDMILTVTPNHRIQVWDMSDGVIPVISNSVKNVVVAECKIHNDASVDISSDGTILVTLLPSGGYLNVTNRLGVYSLKWETLGQCLYLTSFEQNAVSVSLSPLSRYLIVGLASRRVSIVPNDKWTMSRIFLINQNEMPYGSRLPVIRELEQNREQNYMSLNCIRWLPVSGQGLIYATNTGQLRVLS